MKYEPEELFLVIKWLTEKYTGKESSSVTYEKARQLTGAALYCIEEYERRVQSEEGEKSTEIAVKEKSESVSEAYNKGYQLVLDKVWKAKEVYEEIIESFDSYGSRCCYDTVIKGMPEFFVRYDARFYPQDHLLTLDYPLLELPDKLCGIDCIHYYLQAIRIEQRFLKAFPREYIIRVLKGCHREYGELLINICSLVIRDIIGRMLAGEEGAEDGNTEELEDRLKELLGIFMEQEYGKREADKSFRTEAENYLRTDMHSFAVELKNYKKHNGENPVVIC